VAGRIARISRSNVAALRQGDWITDSKLPGFMVRRPRRRALYGMSIRLNGRKRWISLGTEAELTPDQARGEAERIRGLKRQGIDPASERDRRKAAVAVSEAAKRFMAEHVEKKLKPRTAAHYQETLDRLIMPRFWDWRVDSINGADVSQWHGGMSETPTQANRALAILSSLMNWVAGRKWREGNPCRGVVRFKERAVNRYPTPGQLQRIRDAIDELVAEGRLNLYFAAGCKVLMTTGARRSEIFEAQWSWLDVDRRCLTLPQIAPGVKTGAKTIALPRAALDLIRDLPRMDGCPFIFPSLKTNRPFVNFGAQWKMVLERADIGHWRIHDLRHGFASGAVEAGAHLHVIGNQLGHAKPQTTARYAHVGHDGRRDLVEAVADLLGEKRDRVS
jgi:integrase